MGKGLSGPLADQIVTENPLVPGVWIEGLRPVRHSLLNSLATIFRDTERSLAMGILADYAADQPEMLADLLMDADEKQFAVLYPKLNEHGERGAKRLLAEIGKELQPLAEDDKERLAKRQANAAVALLKMGRPEKLWPLLKHGPDPRVRTWIIHKLSPMGADPGAIVKRLEEEPDLSIRRALILSLGEFGEQAIAAGERAPLMERLRELYRNDPDPGLHGAAEWLLHQWKQDGWLKQVEQEWAKNKQQREQRLQSIGKELAKKKANPQWYITSQGQTMVVIPGPVEFLMGSPPTNSQRADDEALHRKRIGRTFAIAAKAVTVEQFKRFNPIFGHSQMFRSPEPDCPVPGVLW